MIGKGRESPGRLKKPRKRLAGRGGGTGYWGKTGSGTFQGTLVGKKKVSKKVGGGLCRHGKMIVEKERPPPLEGGRCVPPPTNSLQWEEFPRVGRVKPGHVRTAVNRKRKHH